MCTNHSHCKYYNYNNLNCSFPHTILKFLIEVWYLTELHQFENKN